MSQTSDTIMPKEAHHPASEWPSRLGALLAAAGVLGAGIALSVVLSHSAREEARVSAQARFDAAATEATSQVERRVSAYAEVLTGLRALFNTGKVSREEFRSYVDALNSKQSLPGLEVLNYAADIDGAARARFEEVQRRDPSLAQFTVYPPGLRDRYHPITMIEPLAGNEQHLGRDVAAAPAVRATLEGGRDTGRLTASGKLIHNRGANSQVGLAMRLPVYQTGAPLDTVEQRRAAYLGSVGAGFLVARMLADLPGMVPDLRLQLYDGGAQPAREAEPLPVTARVAPDKMLFDTAPEQPSGARGASAAQRPGAVTLRRVDSFALGGRLWLVDVTAPEAGATGAGAFQRWLPIIILASGTIISASLAGVLLSLMGSRRRAIVLAQGMTRSLRSSEQCLAEAQGLARMGSWVLDVRSGALQCSDEARRIYGLTTGRSGLDQAQLLAVVPEAQQAALREALQRACSSGQPVEFEHAVHTSDAGDRWVHLNLQGFVVHGEAKLRATVRDETARKRGTVRLELAHEVARELAGEGEADSVMASILAAIGARLRWHAAVCWRLDDEGRVRCVHAWTQGEVAHGFVEAMQRVSGPRDGGPLDAAWSAGNPLWRTIAGAESADTHDHIAACHGLQAALTVPVNAGAQRVALEFFSRVPVSLDRDLEGFMRSMASQLGQYLQRKQAEQALRHMASHDALTGLASRSLLQERLQRAIAQAQRRQTRVAVLFMDLDRFKHVNDSLGHSVGDLLLRDCAARLRSCLRASDTVARFGGDEFVLVLEDLNSAEDVNAPLEKVRDRFATPFDIEGRELRTTASIGISLFPDDGQDAETLLMNADTAMYRAKEQGPGKYHFYSAQLNAHSQQRLTLESDLHHAMARKELFLVYQPKLELASGRICGVEALMRWQHPVHGLVSPAQFIPIAEDAGMIEAMGRWALERACGDARRWHDEGHPVQVSVNLSPRQLNQPQLAAEVEQVLAMAGLSPQALELEITESCVMANPTMAATQLAQLRAIGV
ncbi:bifunctional diguanylate cyclase/phosphodiesterase, partial [Aquabacterium sp.]|uniref:bifunctional diguanylate cyclase/phosphodiesterase n=1 Tax=Aquabacterium sp. TaxID=1872578 RepID=UPI002BF267FC